MEEDLQTLVKVCVKTGLHHGLNAELIDGFCHNHNLTRNQFFYIFAKHIAIEFADGELSYSDGDLPIMDLAAFVGADITPFVLEIYSAFDAGEFYREDDPSGTIPWQKYTLPNIMRILSNEAPAPNT